MNKIVARDLAIFMVFMLLGILATCGYFAYANDVKEVFTPIFLG